ncbi:hypothetical protein BMS3Abin15_00356 [bacterium BMS3Abin15]|nr:hypothetical protein BMS3Abin15_00356 [bacterium BMS3Abin15]
MDRIKRSVEFSLVILILVLGTLGIVFSVKAYPKIFKTKIILESEINVQPEEAIIINFSEPMIPESVVSGLKIIPDIEVNYQWQGSNRKLIITPAIYWSPEETYQLKAEKARNIMFIESDIELSFETMSYPRVENFIPARGEKDVIIDIEDPIKAIFDKPLNDFQVKFAIDPSSELVYQLTSKNTEVEMLSKDSLERGRKYGIKVYIKYKKEENYREIYETFFETKPLPPDQWDKDFTVRLEQAKKFTEPQVKEGKYIDINVKSQVMTIFQDGEILDTFLISSGKRGMDTPQGTYQIHNKHPRPWSKKYGLYMPYWMAFTGSGLYGIHELPEWPSGYKEGTNHLGIPVSHGCVRLGVGPAERIYNWAEIGIPVIIHN